MSTETSQRRRKWFRLSVRGMMLAVLAMALGLSLELQKIREQREAVEAVRKFGGWVYYDHDFVNDKMTPGQEPYAPRWIRKMLGDELFQTVREVCLVSNGFGGRQSDDSGSESADQVLKKVARLPGVRILICSNGLTDDGLKYVGQMADLELLDIYNAHKVTDSGVANLAQLGNLTNIEISSSQITDESLVMLSSLPKMEKMSLQGKSFTNSGLSQLHGKNHLRQLEINSINNLIDDDGVPFLEGFRKLEILDLQNSKVTGPGLDPLQKLPNLKKLRLKGTGLSIDALKTLKQANPGLDISR